MPFCTAAAAKVCRRTCGDTGLITWAVCFVRGEGFAFVLVGHRLYAKWTGAVRSRVQESNNTLFAPECLGGQLCPLHQCPELSPGDLGVDLVGPCIGTKAAIDPGNDV